MHIISLLDQNATTTPSPEIAEETSQKMMLSQSLPKQITDWACTAKTFLDAKLKNFMTAIVLKRNLENFSDDSNGPPSTSSNKQTVQKNIQPLKIKILKQSKPPKCEKEKPRCEAKTNLKRKLENDKEIENKGFNIDGDMAKFLEHLDHHTKDLFQSTK